MRRLSRHILAAALFPLMLAGCSQPKTADIPTQRISMGVVETRGDRNSSRILFLDEQLQELGDLSLKYASVGDVFHSPCLLGDTLYLIPQGYAKSKEGETVLEIDLNTLNVESYSTQQSAMNDVTTNETYLYTCNTLNGTSYIHQVNKASGEIQRAELPNTYISNMIYTNGKLYVFGTVYQSDASAGYVYVYDDTLNLSQSIDISAWGVDQYRATEYQGTIYFTSSTDAQGQPTHVIGALHTSDASIESISLSESFPLDIIVYQDKLFISHYDLVGRTGGGLTIYDLNTKQQTYHALTHGAQQMSMIDSTLYFLSDWAITAYRADTMEQIKTAEITPMDGHYSFLSGMFMTPPKT